MVAKLACVVAVEADEAAAVAWYLAEFSLVLPTVPDVLMAQSFAEPDPVSTPVPPMA